VTWTNIYRENLTLPELVAYEAAAPVESAACGGTHRLFGLSWVYHMHLQRGGPTEGVGKTGAERSNHHRDPARKWQNADGTFSTSYFRERGNSADKMLRINTTGHILEWLALALSDDELVQPWVQAAANALALQILDQGNAPIDSGSMYHAV